MKLLLTSTGLLNENVRNKFLSLFKGVFPDTKVLFITSASKTKKHEWYVNRTKGELLELGIKEDNLITYHSGDKPSKDILNEINLIFVCGGNTFYLLERIRESGLDKDIVEMIKKDVFYIGASAGSIIVSPNIKIAESGDTNDRNLKDLNGFNLVNFTIFPHYTEEDKETVDDIEDKLGIKIKRLTDDQAVLVIDDEDVIINR